MQTTQSTFEAGKNRAFLDNVTGNLWQSYQGISTTSFAVLFSVITTLTKMSIRFDFNQELINVLFPMLFDAGSVSTNPQRNTVTVQFMLKTNFQDWAYPF